MQIRNEIPSDAVAIESVTIAAFRQAGHGSHTEQFIVRALRDSGQLAVSIVAEDSGSVIGHAAASPVTVSGMPCGWYGLGPVSVLPARQGQGVGTLLVEHALGRLRALDAAGCVVLGEPRYYGRFGFNVASSLVLAGVPPQYFQALSFGCPMPSGTVEYHASFKATAQESNAADCHSAAVSAGR